MVSTGYQYDGYSQTNGYYGRVFFKCSICPRSTYIPVAGETMGDLDLNKNKLMNSKLDCDSGPHYSYIYVCKNCGETYSYSSGKCTNQISTTYYTMNCGYN